MGDDLSLEEELLLQVAGRSRPKAKSQGKKRSRRAVSISDDDDEFDAESEDEADDDDDGPADQERRRRSSGSKFKRSRAAVEEEEEGSDEDAFDDGYGSDLMGDEEDRANLMAMNELQREMILAERAEKRDMERERLRNAKLLRQHQQASAQAQMQPRASTRAKQKDNAKLSAMAELVAAKAARAERTTALTKDRRRRDRDSSYSEEDEARLSDSDSDRSARRSSPEERNSPDRGRHSDDDDRGRSRRYTRSDSESDSDDDARSQEGEEADEASMEEALKMQMQRSVLEKWLNEPFLEKTVIGALVRVSIKGGYILAEVIGVVEREPGTYKDPGFPFKSPYAIAEGGKMTNKWFLLQHGTTQRYMPISLVSNHKFNEEEWRKWCSQCEKDNRPQLSMADVNSVRSRFKQALTYTYTAEDVQRMIEEKRAAGIRRNSAAEKARLERLQQAALDKEDMEEASRLAEQIAELDARLATAGGVDRRNVGMASVNKKNAARNFENAFKNVGARPEGARTAEEGVDPFSRRKTRPMSYWTTKRKQAAADGAAGGLSVATGAKGGAGDDALPETPAVAATATENERGDLELNIDLSVLKLAGHRKSLASQLLGPNWQLSSCAHAKPPDLAARKTLTLADYKRRQGIA